MDDLDRLTDEINLQRAANFKRAFDADLAAAVRAERIECARAVCSRCRRGQWLSNVFYHDVGECSAGRLWDRDRAAALASGQTEAEWLASVNALLAEGAK